MPDPQLRLSGPKHNSALGKVIAAVCIAASTVLAFMFSAILLAGIAVFAIFFLTYLWWKTRKLRAQLKQQMQQVERFNQHRPNDNNKTGHKQSNIGGHIIEGEVIRTEFHHISPTKADST